MSKYKLSNSIPFGFGCDESIGMGTPSTSVGCNILYSIIIKYKMKNTHIECAAFEIVCIAVKNIILRHIMHFKRQITRANIK